MPFHSLDGAAPRCADPGRVYLAEGAQVIGDVRLGLDVSIWFNAVVRADNDTITIGDRANIQDGAVVHADPGVPTRIGTDVTVGHRAIIHGASVGDGSLIGMGAVLLNGATVGAQCLVGANALITEGKHFADGSLIVGAPAKCVRALTEMEIAGLRRSADSYVANGHRFAAGLRRVDPVPSPDIADLRSAE
ncbi:gamma carbonic anhydrase family protein [uncultured Sphingomonas sp.]|uniref:gamma carbonic anhydrase family protein n=1 Tax=uncultured Sphingomonas sp. TaxID=158754 RepID=UPI0025FFC366|nr:gamma carbonic anhydrase family protein [uncultured Sphingomonas sp.]